MQRYNICQTLNFLFQQVYDLTFNPNSLMNKLIVMFLIWRRDNYSQGCKSVHITKCNMFAVSVYITYYTGKDTIYFYLRFIYRLNLRLQLLQHGLSPCIANLFHFVGESFNPDPILQWELPGRSMQGKSLCCKTFYIFPRGQISSESQYAKFQVMFFK